MQNITLPNHVELVPEEVILAQATKEFAEGELSEERLNKMLDVAEKVDPMVAAYVIRNSGLTLETIIINSLDEMPRMNALIDKINDHVKASGVNRYVYAKPEGERRFRRENRRYKSIDEWEKSGDGVIITLQKLLPWIRRFNKERKRIAELEAFNKDREAFLDEQKYNAENKVNNRHYKHTPKRGSVLETVYVGKKFKDRRLNFVTRDMTDEGMSTYRPRIHFGADSDPKTFLTGLIDKTSKRYTELRGYRLKEFVFENPAHESDIAIQGLINYLLKKQDGKQSFRKPSTGVRTRPRRVRNY